MKIKLDENLPESLLPALQALGHDADNVRSEGIEGRDLRLEGRNWCREETGTLNVQH